MTRITLEEPRTAGYPVVKRTALFQTFNGAVIKHESRDRLKRSDDGTMVPIVKPNGKHAQELVVIALTLPGTDAPAGLGDQEGTPSPGTIVRLILKGKAFGDWIEAKRSLPDGTVAVGDLVTQTTASAQVYDANGNPSGPETYEQAAIDQARQKGRSVGIYGPITLREPAPDSEWTHKAIAAYKSMQAPVDRVSADFESSTTPPSTWAVGNEAAAFDDPNRPPTIPKSEWEKFSPETKATITRASDKPPLKPPF